MAPGTCYTSIYMPIMDFFVSKKVYIYAFPAYYGSVMLPRVKKIRTYDIISRTYDLISGHGGVSYFHFVRLSDCLCVCLCARYLEKYRTDQLHFWWRVSSDRGRKLFDFEKNRPGVRVCVCVGGGGSGRNLALMIRDRRIFFERPQLLKGTTYTCSYY